MGLDMYLYRKSEDGKPVQVKANYTGPDEEEVFYTTPGYEVAYWRKANQIHNWFVQKHQKGVDECQISDDITVADLKVLYDTCRRALIDRNPKLLEPVDGFFFGGTEIDEWYWMNVVDTVCMLHPIIVDNFGRKEEEQPKFVYQSSW